MQRDDDKRGARDPEQRGTGNGRTSRRQAGFIGRASARGRSGYGSESVRPYLRAELRLKELLTPQFPPPDEEPGREEDR